MTSTQTQLNNDFWARGGQVDEYATTDLRGAEAAILERYADTLAGSVLELGCGAGRLTGHLTRISANVHGLDISEAMVEHCRAAYPDATFSVGDMCELDDGPYDAIVAPFNVIDVLDHDERIAQLERMRSALTARGLLIFSSHNLAFAPLIQPPTTISFYSKRELFDSVVRMPLRVRNRRRLLPYEETNEDYAILNDNAHDYSVLHYYVSRDAQERQLRTAGLRLLECVALDGTVVERGQDAPECAELHYVARRI